MELSAGHREGHGLPYMMPEGGVETFGKYGMLRKSYLQEHRKGTYINLINQRKLTAYLAGIDRTARTQIEETVEAMKAEAGVTEELKSRAPMEWAGRMTVLRHLAEDAVYRELIYR